MVEVDRDRRDQRRRDEGQRQPPAGDRGERQQEHHAGRQVGRLVDDAVGDRPCRPDQKLPHPSIATTAAMRTNASFGSVRRNDSV